LPYSLARRAERKKKNRVAMAAGVLRVPIELYPGRTLHITVFDEVSNGAEVCAWVKQAGADFASIDARMIVHTAQLFAAAVQALHAAERLKLVTHALHSEIVCALSGLNQINEAFRRFGAGPACVRIAIVTFDEAAALRLTELISGTLVDPSSLAANYDDVAVHKAYKVTDAELQVGSLADAIVSRIATARCA
jgi:tRNA threonylcarbamoyladenosine modification (KEOPS) complex Cgi121 subunit